MATTLRRLDGLPSNPSAMYHDAQNVVITTHSVTITVAEASHVLTDVGCDIYISNLLVDDCLHDHVANHIYAFSHVFVLAVAEAYHRHAGDATYASVIYRAWTDALDPPRLPTMECDGDFGERGVTREGGLVMPGLEIESRSGSRMSGKLPDMEISATGTLNAQLTASATLPVLELSSRAGIRGGTMRLPVLELSAGTAAVHVGTLDKRLPGIEITASGEETNLGTMTADLPALQATISIDVEYLASLAATIPPPLISATGSGVSHMTLSGILPTLTMVSLMEGTSLELVGYIPPPVMMIAGEGAGMSTIIEETRYDDLVLRYRR